MKRVVAALAGALLVLVAILTWRALHFPSRQVVVQLAAPVALDSAAAVERFAGALRFETVSYDTEVANGDEFRRLHAYLAAQFPLVHARLQRETVNEYSLLYTWPGRDAKRQPVILLSHLDVVPVEPGTETQWTQPPFSGRVADGYVWGRGSLDDKFGVVAILEAAETLLRDGYQPDATVYFAFGHDEEVGGPHGAVQVAQLLASRGVHADFVLDEGGSLAHDVLPGFSGLLGLVGTAEKGSVSVELSVHGAGGHSSAPPPHTSIGLVSRAVYEVERHPLPARLRGAARDLLEYAGPELPLRYRFALANLWLLRPLVEQALATFPPTNASIRTTTAATMISGGVKDNVLPSTARAVVNFRILPGDSVQSVVDHVRRVVEDPLVEVRALDGAREPSPESPLDAPSFTRLQQTIRAVYPTAVVAPYLTIGGTDARHYTGVTRNIYRFTPIIGDNSDLARIHGTDERKPVENYLRSIQFFIELLKHA